MDDQEMPARPARRRWLAPVGLLLGGLLAGGIVGATQVAGAATSSTSPTPAVSVPAPPSGAMDPASMDHGPGEKLLTGDTAKEVEAAALGEVPGATVIRVETDSEGTYEAHLQKQDGSYVTVTLDENLNVTGTEQGFGPGPGGPGCPPGPPPRSATDTTGSTT